MTDPSGARRRIRLAALVAITAALAGWVGITISRRPIEFPLNDFVEYWSAAVVFLRSGNPYDGGELLPLQREASGDPEQAQAVMMWNPPWALIVLAPLGLLPVRIAHLLWLAMQVAMVAVSADLLWRVYGGNARRAWVAWLVALTFTPTLLLVFYGQLGGLCLLGLAGFLFFRNRGRPATAGAFAALTALKPHLFFAFGLVLILDAINRDGRRALAGGLVVLVLMAGLAGAIHPDIYSHYRAALAGAGNTDMQQHLRDWKLPVVSYWLRQWIAPDQFWVQFVPTLLASVGVVVYWLGRRNRWDWPAEMPRLVMVSVLAAAYGAWIFDLVVLLVPIIQAAALYSLVRPTLRTAAVWIAFAIVNGAALVVPPLLIPVFGWTGLYYYIVFAPTIVVWYIWAIRSTPAPVTNFAAPP